MPTTPIACISSLDQEHVTLCLRYWSIDPSGKWTEPVAAIRSSTSLTQPALLSIVQLSCRAYLRTHRCNECGDPAELRTRSDFEKFIPVFPRARSPRYTCERCKFEERDRVAKAEQIAAARHAESIESRLRQIESQLVAVDYATLDDVQSFILYATLIAADLSHGATILPPLPAQPAKLAPTEDLAALTYQRLWQSGILVPSITADPRYVAVNESGELELAYNMTPWRLAPDSTGRTVEQILAVLSDRLSSLAPLALEDIWYMVAESECKRYFEKQCDRYRFSKPGLFNDKVVQVVREYLAELSIGQLWNIIFYSLKDLASLAQERRHAQAHVYNMIPGTIRRYCEHRLSNHREIRPWSRPPLATESWMTIILLDKVLGNGNHMFEWLTGSEVISYASETSQGGNWPDDGFSDVVS